MCYPKTFSVRVSLEKRSSDALNAMVGNVMVLRTDALMVGIDDDGDEDQEELDWMVNVANEGRIEGEVVTGNADLPDHIHHHLYCMSK